MQAFSVCELEIRLISAIILFSTIMATEKSSEDQLRPGTSIPLPHTSHDETAISVQKMQHHPSSLTSYTSNTMDDREVEKPAAARSESKDHPQPIDYAPIRGTVDQDDDGLERTVSQIYGGLSEDERSKLHRLASSMHRTKSYQTGAESELDRQDTLAGVDDDDPRLDPSKPEFDIYVWARAFMQAMDEEQIKSRRAGFTFKNLEVTGSGAAINLQKDFASAFMTPFRLGEYFSFGSKPEKKILKNFNGLVKSGEMLVVLGRPGSGCSTFLKTICGELTGLKLDENSVIHYNGMADGNGERKC